MANTPDTENNTLGGRLSRYAKVGVSMGGLAARMAGEKYLGIAIDRDKHALQLKEALGGLRGPLMKVAQLLATIPDALPSEYVQELIQLQSNAPPMGWSFVKRRMMAELGADWESRFASFSHEATAAASLGQVHRAISHDGRDLACKLQYPDMLSAVDADLNQLKIVMGIFEQYDKAVVTKQIHAEVSARLREELDYVQELKHMQLYTEMLAGEDAVHVPVPVPELSTGRLLTMTWLDGEGLLTFVDSNLEKRNQLAINMFRAWYVPFYYYGVIHGDPHLGNYSIRPDGNVNLLDFGCVRTFRPPFVNGVIELYKALQTNDRERAAHAYEIWGFKNLNNDLIDVLNIWAGFIYGPILDDRTRKIGETNNGVYGRETAEKVHLELKKVGGVEVPREFVFMDRAALGLGSVFIHLKAELNWHDLFHDMIEGFTESGLAERQSTTFAKFGIGLPV